MAQDWIELFNGEDLAGWRMRHTDREHKWAVQDGILDNTGQGVDILTEREFGRFRVAYRIPRAGG